MSPRTKYILFQARYGWVMTVGAILAVSLLDRGKLGMALVAAGLTVMASVGTYLRTDRPKALALARDK